MTTKNNALDSTSEGANTNLFMFTSQMAFVKQMAKLHGIEIHTSSNGFMVSRWGLTKVFADKDEVMKFLRKMGVEA